MSDETTLLPCPFCGSRYTQVRWIGFKDKSNGAFESGFRGECTECFELTRAFSTEAEAIAAWNTRAELGSGTLTAERLEKAKACKSSEELAALAAELIAERHVETCEMEYVSDFMSWHCKACDMMDMAPRDPKPRFCKWCGRQVE